MVELALLDTTTNLFIGFSRHEGLSILWQAILLKNRLQMPSNLHPIATACSLSLVHHMNMLLRHRDSASSTGATSAEAPQLVLKMHLLSNQEAIDQCYVLIEKSNKLEIG